MFTEETIKNAAKNKLSEIVNNVLDDRHDVVFTVHIEGHEQYDLRVVEFESTEQMSEVYETKIMFACKYQTLNVPDLLEKNVSLKITHRIDGDRWLHGYIEAVQQLDDSPDWQQYKIIVRPTLNRLKYRSNCRIFQKMHVEDIINEIFKKHGISLVNWTKTQQREKREYCVQYRESDLDFIQRLMAEEGMSYYFKQAESGHTLFITDATVTNAPLEKKSELEYNSTPGGSIKDTYVNKFLLESGVRSENYAMNDRYFKYPDYTLMHSDNETNASNHPYNKYDPKGGFKDDLHGKQYTKYWKESERWDRELGRGETNSIFMNAGFRFTMHGHSNQRHDQTYLITKVVHHGVQPQSMEEAAGEEPSRYYSEFDCIPAKTPFRAPQRIGKTLVEGPQIATVVGPKDEEIHCDEFARVKVKFHWDREMNADEHSSCWIRIANNWAGQGWGQVSIPRIGQEVIVDFVEGDPEQPIITGRTYNARNMPPYSLPANRTKSGIKSKTHKGAGFNEFSFEDDAGREQIYMHAQKDHDTVIENDESHFIGNTRSKRVEVDQSESIGQDKKIDIGRDHGEQIGRDVVYRVGRNQQMNIGKDFIQFIDNQRREVTKADAEYEYKADKTEQVYGNETRKVGKTHMMRAKEINIEAVDKFTIAAPGGSIVLDKSGVKIYANKIDLFAPVNQSIESPPQVGNVNYDPEKSLPFCEICSFADEEA